MKIGEFAKIHNHDTDNGKEVKIIGLAHKEDGMNASYITKCVEWGMVKTYPDYQLDIPRPVIYL